MANAALPGPACACRRLFLFTASAEMGLAACGVAPLHSPQGLAFCRWRPVAGGGQLKRPPGVRGQALRPGRRAAGASCSGRTSQHLARSGMNTLFFLSMSVVALSNVCQDNSACDAVCSRMSCTSTPSACLYGCPTDGCCCCGQTVDRRLGAIPEHHKTSRSLAASDCGSAAYDKFEWSVPTVWYSRRRLRETTNITDAAGYDDRYAPNPCATHCPKVHLCFSNELGRGFPSRDMACPIGYECRNLLGKLSTSSH
jgi:hypothetical protein